MTDSVVDYDAWKRGYMPPSEHVLIDELSYRGAKVVSASHGATTGWWLVVKGNVDRKKLSQIAKNIHLMMEFLDEDEASGGTPAAASTESTPDRTDTEKEG